MERRLAAIFAADVAGYSRLMSQDEAGTLSALLAHRQELIEPKIAAHRGRLVKTTGDGMLIEFPSAIDAVACALEMQKGMVERNADLPADRRIDFRIGINLGDVIVEGSDIYGDGVNLAVRIEALAEPGGICISGDVHRQIRQKLGAEFRDLGERMVKNFSEPIRVYSRPGFQGDAAPHTPALSSEAAPAIRSQPTVAVLPFENLSGDPKQAYFSDGITEDIVTELSRFHTLNVIAGATSFAYRDRPVSLRRLGIETNAQYVVEGSVRKAGKRIRITTQLIDCASGTHLWADRYDRRASDIFAVQDELVRCIVATLEDRVAQAQLDQIKRRPPASLAAYDYWLRGRQLTREFSMEGDARARAFFEKAIELDPSFARAYASLAEIHNCIAIVSPRGPQTTGDLDRAFDYATKAIELDPTDARAHVDLGWNLMLRRRFDRAEKHFDLAGALNPNDANVMIARAQAAAYLGAPELGLQLAQGAIGLNPQHPDYYLAYLATIYFVAGQYDRAAATVELVPNVLPEMEAWRAASLAHLGDLKAARKAARRFVETVRARWAHPSEPGMGDYVHWLLGVAPMRRRQDSDRLIAGLRKAGIAARGRTLRA